MTLLAQLKQALDALPPFSAGEQLVRFEHASPKGPQHFECQLVALDSLACSFTRLSLRATALAGKSNDELRKTAERLSARLTYLLEPISPIEFDAQGCVVQMRSNPPHKELDRTTYYELFVSCSGELALCRYSRASGQVRQVIPAHLTREVLLRLAADFSTVAG